MKPFEIPYNFDLNLIINLKTLHLDEDLIYCIYTVPFGGDYKGVPRDDKTEELHSTMTRDAYAAHMKYINEQFPGKLQLLLQSRYLVKDAEWLQWYIDLGFTKFCVGNYEQAKIIKSINPKFDVVASLVMKLQPDDLIAHPEYKDVFDGIILFWNYNRDFELLKKLPRKDYKYIMLANCFCNQSCDGTHHFEMDPIDFEKLYCPHDRYVKAGIPTPWEESSGLRPQDLSLFFPYVDAFKLQAREYPTGEIISELLTYMQENRKAFWRFDNTMLPDINLYIKKDKSV